MVNYRFNQHPTKVLPVQQEKSQLWVGLEPLQLSQLTPSLKSPADIDSSSVADSVAFPFPRLVSRNLYFDHGCFFMHNLADYF